MDTRVNLLAITIKAGNKQERSHVGEQIEHVQQVICGTGEIADADKGYVSGEFCRALEQRSVTPHFAVISTSPPQPENVALCRRADVAVRERMEARIT